MLNRYLTDKNFVVRFTSIISIKTVWCIIVSNQIIIRHTIPPYLKDHSFLQNRSSYKGSGVKVVRGCELKKRWT